MDVVRAGLSYKFDPDRFGLGYTGATGPAPSALRRTRALGVTVGLTNQFWVNSFGIGTSSNSYAQEAATLQVVTAHGYIWIADSLGVPVNELLSHFQKAVRHPLPWVEVNAAPVQDVAHHDVDLLRLLPIPKHNEHDSGPYITAALLIARNPQTGIQNVSIHRCQVSGPDRIGVLLLPRHTQHYFRIAEQAGEALEIALVIGVHPACILASQAIALTAQMQTMASGT